MPPDLVQAIGQAIRGVTARGAAEEEMVRAFALPFSFPEFESYLNSTGNSGPGLTGLTYQVMRYLPKDSLYQLFYAMNKMWRAGHHIPQFWKWKGLHAIPKPSVVRVRGLQDLRPIGLLEVARKLWTRMVMGRIKQALKRHQHLRPDMREGYPTKLLTVPCCKSLI